MPMEVWICDMCLVILLQIEVFEWQIILPHKYLQMFLFLQAFH